MNHSNQERDTRTAARFLLAACVVGVGALYFGRRHVRAQRQRLAALTEQDQPIGTPCPGDILLFHNAKGLNKLITLFTGSPFYHVGIYAGNNQAVEARTPGVQRNDLSDRAGTFVVVPAPEGRGRVALAWAETQIGDGYDKLDVAVIILDRLCRFLHFNYTSSNRFSCGEFVAVAFDKAGVRLVPDRDLDDVVPGDFASLIPDSERQRKIH